MSGTRSECGLMPVSLLLCCSAVIGEIDEDMEKRLDFSTVKAEPLNAIVH
jgi:hypothetical protein